MNTKYHIFTNSSSNNRVIVWDNVAGNDFGSQNITDGAFITTVENRSGYLPHIIYFNLNVVSDTPFLQIRVPAELGTRSGHDLVFHFSDETTHVMESEAAWDGSDVLYILTCADLKALAEKEIDHYCFQGLARSLNGDMSSALKLSSLRMNQYDKETGARLFREYVCDFIQILKEEFGIELQSLASKEPSSQEKPSEENHTEVLLGRKIDTDISKIKDVSGIVPQITFEAKVFGIDVRETRSGYTIFTIKTQLRIDRRKSYEDCDDLFELY